MKGPENAKTTEAYLSALPEPRQTALRKLDAAIRKAVPKLKRGFGHGMIAYGPCHYKGAGGREGDSRIICLASQSVRNCTIFGRLL